MYKKFTVHLDALVIQINFQTINRINLTYIQTHAHALESQLIKACSLSASEGIRDFHEGFRSYKLPGMYTSVLPVYMQTTGTSFSRFSAS